MTIWKCFKDEQPEIGKLLVVFRSNRKHLTYCTAKLENNNGKMFWRSLVSNNALKIESDDAWHYFNAYTQTKTYE